ncbi:nuclear transport factor 2 family protein [Sphingomonas sp. SRS2]|uniref:nuclear transport factor 2 family protein n=1 Tax=Sphingomonas sp. SRS2 TaxID=133190 RepID=UPI0006184DE1|nr:nuclear transport factor 2 family protein [Sphingomonas sp. SRS2]KKC26661.1 hypothetical protein WP12_06845 [Sphingomonas sp. SRS2]
MTIEQNKRTARRLVESLGNNGDTDAFDLLDTELVWTVMADSGSFPVAGDMSKSQFIDHFEGFRNALPEGINVVVTGMTAEGNRVAVEAESTAVLANGNRLNQVYHFLIEIEGSSITRVREYIDTAHAVRVFGGDK